MDNILKKLREEAKFTQDDVAHKLGVTVNTIQNWERTEKIGKEQLHKLLELYKIDQGMQNQVVLSIFGDNCTKGNAVADNFPHFLFKDRPNISARARKIVLSPAEMNLFGYLYYITTIINESNYNFGPKEWPVEYSVFKDYGGYFETMNMANEIRGKIGNFQYIDRNSYRRSFQEYNQKPKDHLRFLRFIYQYGLRNPGTTFSYCALSKSEILETINDLPDIEEVHIENLYDYCKAVEKDVCIGTSEESYFDKSKYGLPDIISSIVKLTKKSSCSYSNKCEYEMCFKNVLAKCFCIDGIEADDEKYLAGKKQYLSDRKMFDDHPGLYSKEPSFDFKFVYYLKLTETGKEYIKWFES